MPKPYPKEFRDGVVRVAESRGPGVTVEQIANDFGVHPMTLTKWLARSRATRQAVESGPLSPGDRDAELRELRQRNRLLKQEVRCSAGRRRIWGRRICREKGSTRS